PATIVTRVSVDVIVETAHQAVGLPVRVEVGRGGTHVADHDLVPVRRVGIGGALGQVDDVGRNLHDHAVLDDLEAGGNRKAGVEHLVPVERTVAIHVLEDHDA